MTTDTFFSLPFFDDNHRALLHDASAWAKDHFSKAHKEVRGEEALKYCRNLVTELGQANWIKYSVPEAYGGALTKLDVRSLSILREVFAYHSALADFSFAMQGLGSGPISLFGTIAQKQEYLPSVASGEKIAAFALSEEKAGSDVSAITTTATLSKGEWILNGTKAWISNAGIADFYVVFARTGEEGSGAAGISAFIVDSNTQGLALKELVEITSPHPLGTIELKNCKVRKEALLGEVGQGFKIAMATLDVFRSTVGAAAIGFAKRALDEALNYTKSRTIFGNTLSEFQITQTKLAEMATEIDASALLVYRASWLKDSGADRVTREASMAKWYATESAQKVIDQAVQLFGGLGVVAENTVERLYRDIRPLRIYEGTTEVQKLVIARQLLK